MKKSLILFCSVIISLFLISQEVTETYDQYGNTLPGLPGGDYSTQTTEGGNEWQSIGPFGGDVLDIAIDPTNTDLVYLAAGYPYSRSEAEEPWMVMESLLDLSPSGIYCIEANNDGVLYAGGYSTYGKIFESTDQGTSWQQNLLLSGNGVLSITIDPSNQDIIYVTTTTNISGSNNKVIIKSTDAGASWTSIDMVNYFPIGMACNDLAVDPDDSDILVALGDGGFLFTSKAIISTDGGINWQDITSGLPADRPFNDVTIYNGIIYISGGQLFGGNTMGIYKSTDNGSSWDDISIGFPIKVVNDLVVHPDDENIMYAATEGDGVYYSSDAGDNWTYITGGAGDNGSCRKILINPGDYSNIFGGFLSLGVCISDNGGEDYSSSSVGIASLKLNDIEVDPDNVDVILASFEAENSGGCYLFDPDAGDWGLVTSLPATRFSAVSVGIDGRMYAWSNGPTTVAAEGLYRSSDGGDTWENMGPNVGPVFETQIYALELSATDADLLFIGGNNFGANGWASMIYRSTDAGETWENVFMGPDNDGFRYIHIDPSSDDETVYAAYKSEAPGAGFLKSIDGGTNWLPINSGISTNTKWGSCIISDPTDSDILYGGAGGYGGTPGIVYKSEDAGMSWVTTDISQSNNYSKVTDMVISPTDPNILYAATSINGVFITENGFNWVDANEGLLASNITGFSRLFENEDEELGFYASSFSNSAFYQGMSDGTTIGIKKNKISLSGFNILPNPATGMISIELLNNEIHVSGISIYSLNGSELFHKKLSSGELNTSRININELPGGVYQVVLETSQGKVAEKLVIVK